MTLVAQAYKNIKNPKERKIASDILCSCINVDEKFKETFSKKTKRKHIKFEANDRAGVDIMLTLEKEDMNEIGIIYHKKRGYHKAIWYIQEGRYWEIPTKGENYVMEIILKEFPRKYVNYIQDGMSRKWQIVKDLACMSNELDNNTTIYFDARYPQKHYHIFTNFNLKTTQ